MNISERGPTRDGTRPAAICADIASRLASVGHPPGSPLVAGISGGADSTALLVSLAAGRAALGCVTAVHVEHRTRGRAGLRDALFVTALARSLAIEGIFLRGRRGAVGRGNLEARCRVERETALQRVARIVAAGSVCLAHTRDDLAETVVLRLARGAGPLALGGMQTRRADGLCRPLLGLRRGDLRSGLRRVGVPHVEDATNASDVPLRNRVRRHLLPVADAVLGVDFIERLAHLAEDLQAQRGLVEDVLRGLLPAPGEPLALGFLRAAGGRAAALVRIWLARARPDLAVNRRQIAAALALAAADRRPSGRVDLGQGWALVRRYETLVVQQVGLPLPLSLDGAWLVLPGTLDLRDGRRLAARLEHEPLPGGHVLLEAPRSPALRVRHPRAGDRLRLAAGTRKLADVLIDRRVPRDRRPGLLLVEDAGDILWVEETGPAAGRAWRGSGAALVLSIEGVFAGSAGL